MCNTYYPYVEGGTSTNSFSLGSCCKRLQQGIGFPYQRSSTTSTKLFNASNLIAMFLLARSRAVHIALLISLLSTIQPFMISKLESPTQYKASRSNRYLPRFQEKLVDDSITTGTESRNQDRLLASNTIVQTSAHMFLLSAPLGMMLDNFHGMNSEKIICTMMPLLQI